MATEILMPKRGFIMSEGTIIEWLKQPGDLIEKGEPILIIETEKVTTEVEAPAAGVMGPILVQPGTTVPVTTTIGYILDTGEEPPSPPLTPERATEPAEVEAKSAPVSPVARQLAKEHGVDLAHIQGSGPGGRIVKRDVEAYVQEQGEPGAPGEAQAIAYEVKHLTSVQKVAALRMTQSFQSAPHFYLSKEVDAGEIVALRERLLEAIEANTGVRLSYTDLLVKCVARSLESHPLLNATLDGEQVKVFSEVNVGVAVDTPDGLVVPVIQRANARPLSEICQLRQELVDKARNKRLSLDDLAGGTFTLTNLGMFGIDVFSAIINPPQTAILAAGEIIDKPAVVSSQVTVRPKMWLTLSVDHRVADGAAGARFLRTLVGYLQEPLWLLG